jgi:hypothetical protein
MSRQIYWFSIERPRFNQIISNLTELTRGADFTLLKHLLPAVDISPFTVRLQTHDDPFILQNPGNLNIEADPMQTLIYVITHSFFYSV